LVVSTDYFDDVAGLLLSPPSVLSVDQEQTKDAQEAPPPPPQSEEMFSWTPLGSTNTATLNLLTE
jgi:hypothetical protein